MTHSLMSRRNGGKAGVTSQNHGSPHALSKRMFRKAWCNWFPASVQSPTHMPIWVPGTHHQIKSSGFFPLLHFRSAALSEHPRSKCQALNPRHVILKAPMRGDPLPPSALPQTGGAKRGRGTCPGPLGRFWIQSLLRPPKPALFPNTVLGTMHRGLQGSLVFTCGVGGGLRCAGWALPRCQVQAEAPSAAASPAAGAWRRLPSQDTLSGSSW